MKKGEKMNQAMQQNLKKAKRIKAASQAANLARARWLPWWQISWLAGWLWLAALLTALVISAFWEVLLHCLTQVSAFFACK